MAVAADDAKRPRIMLENGLSVQWLGDGTYPLAWYHGHDPISRAACTELCVVNNEAELPARIADLEARFPAVRGTLTGENRALVLESSRAMADFGHDVRVVESDVPLAEAVAVSMRGMTFKAWSEGGRFASLAQMDAAMRERIVTRRTDVPLSEFVFPLDYDGHLLAARPDGLYRADVVGTLADAHWYRAVFDRTTDGDWTLFDEVADDCSARLAAAVRREIADRLRDAFVTNLALFAGIEVRRHEHRAALFCARAATAQNRAGRLEALRGERAALGDVQYVRALCADARHREPWEIQDCEANVGALRAVRPATE